MKSDKIKIIDNTYVSDIEPSSAILILNVRFPGLAATILKIGYPCFHVAI